MSHLTASENKVWASSNTGTLAHAMLRTNADGRLVAACRGSITRASTVNLVAREDVQWQLCGKCDEAWNAHVDLVESSMQPMEAEEGFNVYGGAPVQVEAERVQVEAEQAATVTERRSTTTWRLQSRNGRSGAWHDVSEHISEAAAVHRGRALECGYLSAWRYRVVKTVTELLTTTSTTPRRGLHGPVLRGWGRALRLRRGGRRHPGDRLPVDLPLRGPVRLRRTQRRLDDHQRVWPRHPRAARWGHADRALTPPGLSTNTAPGTSSGGGVAFPAPVL